MFILRILSKNASNVFMADFTKTLFEIYKAKIEAQAPQRHNTPSRDSYRRQLGGKYNKFAGLAEDPVCNGNFTNLSNNALNENDSFLVSCSNDSLKWAQEVQLCCQLR